MHGSMATLSDNSGTKSPVSDKVSSSKGFQEVPQKFPLEKVFRKRSRLMYPQLIPRVKQYLEACVNKFGSKVLQTINVEQMASSLQCQYKDFARKKRSQFTIEVDKAYRLIMQSEKFPEVLPESLSNGDHRGKSTKRLRLGEQASNASPCNAGQPHGSEYKGGNMMNEMLLRMYKGSHSGAPSNSLPVTSSSQNDASLCDSFPPEDQQTFVIDRTPSCSARHSTTLSSTGTQLTGTRLTDTNSNEARRSQLSLDDCMIVSVERAEAGDASVVANKASYQDASIGPDMGSWSENLDSARPPVAVNFSGAASETGGMKNETKRSIRKRKRLADATSEDEQPAKKSDKAFLKSTITFADVGGLSETLKDELRDLVLPLKDPEMMELIRAWSAIPPLGILLHGPSGCGKSLLAEAIAGEFDLPLLKLTSTDIVSGISGESEENVSNIFKEAELNSPCILFFDEIDVIAPKKDSNSRMMEQRIVSEIASCMTDLRRRVGARVLVLGAARQLESIHSVLRTTGRFDREMDLGIPGEEARISILEVLCRNTPLQPDFDFQHVAQLTPGYVGSDLAALTHTTKMIAIKRVFTNRRLQEHKSELVAVNADVSTVTSGALEEEMVESSEAGAVTGLENNAENSLVNSRQDMFLIMEDFKGAISGIQPTMLRDGFMSISEVKWSDIGGLGAIKQELMHNIMGPVKHSESAARYGMTRPYSVLLVGPPGCGKTMIAKAIANESGLNFILVNGPELINKYVGESERGVRQVFERAQNCAPCVIFFDEVDSICPNRSSDHGEGNSASRVVNQLLAVMDGAQQRKKVFLIGATNRPDVIDPALLRPGRFAKMVYVGLPDAAERHEILLALTKNGTVPPLADVTDLYKLANDERCNGLTGADLMGLVSAVSYRGFANYLDRVESSLDTSSSYEVVAVPWKFFDEALDKLRPSVNGTDRLRYVKLKESIESKATVMPSTLNY